MSHVSALQDISSSFSSQPIIIALSDWDHTSVPVPIAESVSSKRKATVFAGSRLIVHLHLYD